NRRPRIRDRRVPFGTGEGESRLEGNSKSGRKPGTGPGSALGEASGLPKFLPRKIRPSSWPLAKSPAKRPFTFSLDLFYNIAKGKGNSEPPPKTNPPSGEKEEPKMAKKEKETKVTEAQTTEKKIVTPKDLAEELRQAG